LPLRAFVWLSASPLCDFITFVWFVCWCHLRATWLLSHDLFVGVTFVWLCWFHTICFLASPSCDFVTFTWFCLLDFVTFAWFVCWRRIHTTLFGCAHRVRAISLLSRDLFVGVTFTWLCLVVSVAFVQFHYFHAICLLSSPSCDFIKESCPGYQSKKCRPRLRPSCRREVYISGRRLFWPFRFYDASFTSGVSLLTVCILGLYLF
jgi:hypothetical protein